MRRPDFEIDITPVEATGFEPLNYHYPSRAGRTDAGARLSHGLDGEFGEGLVPMEKEFVQALYEMGAVRVGQFRGNLHEKYPDAPPLPVYIDVGSLRGDPSTRAFALDAYDSLLQDLGLESGELANMLFADVPSGPTPFVAALADNYTVGMITPHSEDKTHGLSTKIDGLSRVNRGKDAILFEDVISSGDSVLKAVRVLNLEDIEVEAVLALVDHNIGGSQILEGRVGRIFSFISSDKIIAAGLRGKVFNQGQYDGVVKGLGDLRRYLSKAADLKNP
jgi:orotate phosphoribosyltransferase